MKQYTKEVEDFIKKNVLPKLGFKEITEDNIDDIVDYLLDEYEVPLGAKSDSWHKLSKEEEEELRLASKCVTEITTDADWSE